MRHIVIFLFLACIVYACDKDVSDDSYEYEDKEYNTVNIGTQDLLVLHVYNGNVAITGYESASDLILDITKIVKSNESVSDAEAHMSDISVSVEEYTHEIYVFVDHPLGSEFNYTVNFTITLPLIFDFDILVGNGNVTIESTSENISVDVNNGNTSADVILLDPCSVDFVTGNGNISLYMPQSTNAYLNASVGNGYVSSIELTIQNQVCSNNQLYGDIGSGTGNIRLSSGNGNILIVGATP